MQGKKAWQRLETLPSHGDECNDSPMPQTVTRATHDPAVFSPTSARLLKHIPATPMLNSTQNLGWENLAQKKKKHAKKIQYIVAQGNVEYLSTKVVGVSYGVVLELLI